VGDFGFFVYFTREIKYAQSVLGATGADELLIFYRQLN
jgi:hypothetical protein